LETDANDRVNEVAELMAAAELREAELSERDAELALRTESRARAAYDLDSPNHLVLVPTAGGYELVERPGSPPLVGGEVEDILAGGWRFVTSKIGRSPLPRDRRPCAYLQPLQ
jgi:hypothetical protein